MTSRLRRRSLNLEANGSPAADPRPGVRAPPGRVQKRSPFSPTGLTWPCAGEGTGVPGGRTSRCPTPQGQVRRRPGSIRVWRGGRGRRQGRC